MNGWFTSGTWHGYTDVFIAGLGVTGVAPNTFTLSDNYLCLRGEAEAFTSEGSVSGFVWNVNQAMTTPNPPMAVTPTGTGLKIDALGASTSMLALLTDGTTSWCAPIPSANGGLIPWSTFRTECWLGAGEGTPYAMQPFQAVQLLVRSALREKKTYCFCVVGLGPN